MRNHYTLFHSSYSLQRKGLESIIYLNIDRLAVFCCISSCVLQFLIIVGNMSLMFTKYKRWTFDYQEKEDGLLPFQFSGKTSIVFIFDFMIITFLLGTLLSFRC